MSDNQNIKKLLAQRDAINARIQQAQARERDEARKLETRRKIIVGGCILSALSENPELEKLVKAELSVRVTRPNDKAALSDLLNDANNMSAATTIPPPKISE